MTSIRWNLAKNICTGCGKEIELVKDLYILEKRAFFLFQSLPYCKQCLINRIKMEGIESRGIKAA